MSYVLVPHEHDVTRLLVKVVLRATRGLPSDRAWRPDHGAGGCSTSSNSPSATSTRSRPRLSALIRSLRKERRRSTDAVIVSQVRLKAITRAAAQAEVHAERWRCINTTSAVSAPRWLGLPTVRRAPNNRAELPNALLHRSRASLGRRRRSGMLCARHPQPDCASPPVRSCSGCPLADLRTEARCSCRASGSGRWSRLTGSQR
jgi:hypothetical protein